MGLHMIKAIQYVRQKTEVQHWRVNAKCWYWRARVLSELQSIGNGRSDAGHVGRTGTHRALLDTWIEQAHIGLYLTRG